MDMIVDGDRNFRVEGNPRDVLAAVVAVSDYVRERGRAILSVRANGEDISAEKLVERLRDKPFSDVAALEITSEEVGVLVGDCLQDLEKVLPDFPDACHSLAQVFHSEVPEDGYEPFYMLAEIWSHVKSREMMIADALDLSLETLQLDDRSITALHEELNGHLREAATALEKEDCVLLGDLLEYELAPRAEAEVRIVDLLKALAKERFG